MSNPFDDDFEPEPDPGAEQYAVVDILGHTRYVGRVCEVAQYGCAGIQIEPLYGDRLLPPIFHAGAALYGVTPCTREQGIAMAGKSPWQFPASMRHLLPEPEPEPQEALQAPSSGPGFVPGQEVITLVDILDVHHQVRVAAGTVGTISSDLGGDEYEVAFDGVDHLANHVQLSLVVWRDDEAHPITRPSDALHSQR